MRAEWGDVLEAKVKIWPRWLFLTHDCCDYDDGDEGCSWKGACKCWCRRGGWMIAFIRLPKGYEVKDVNASSVALDVLGIQVPMSACRILWRRILIAKFDRASVIELLCPLIEHMVPWAKQKVTLIVTGNLYDGTAFQGQDTIKVCLGH